MLTENSVQRMRFLGRMLLRIVLSVSLVCAQVLAQSTGSVPPTGQKPPAQNQTAAPGQAPRTAPADMAAIHKAFQDDLRAKARKLEGPRTVNGIAYDTDTIARAMATRDVYVGQLANFISQLSSFSTAKPDVQAPRIKDLIRLSNDIGLAQQVMKDAEGGERTYIAHVTAGNPAGDNTPWISLLQFGNLSTDAAKKAESFDPAEAAWWSAFAQQPAEQQPALLSQHILSLYDSDPLLGVVDSGIFTSQSFADAIQGLAVSNGDPNAIEKVGPELKRLINLAVQQAHEEINRVNDFTRNDQFVEFFQPQYVRARVFAADLWGPNERANFEEYACLYNGNEAAEDEVTHLELAIVVGGIAVVAIVAAPLGGLALSGAGVEGSEVTAVVLTGQTIGAGMNAATMTFQLVWDGYEYRVVSNELENAQKGAGVLGQSNVAGLKQQASGAGDQVILDGIFVAIGAKDFKAAVEKAAAARALSTGTESAANTAGAGPSANSGASTNAGTGASARAAAGVAAPGDEAGLQQLWAFGVSDSEIGQARRLVATADDPRVSRIQRDAASEMRKDLEIIGNLPTLEAKVRAAGVTQDVIQAARTSAIDKVRAGGAIDIVETLAQDWRFELFVRTALAQGKKIIVPNDLLARFTEQLGESLAGQTLQFIQNDTVLWRLRTKLTVLGRGTTPVPFTRDEIDLLGRVLRMPNAENLLVFTSEKASDMQIDQLLSDKELATARQFFNSPNRLAIARGETALPVPPPPAVAAPSAVTVVPNTFPTMLLNPNTGELITAAQAEGLAAAELRLISPEDVGALANGPLKDALTKRMLGEAAAIQADAALNPQSVNAMQLAWASRTLVLLGSPKPDNTPKKVSFNASGGGKTIGMVCPRISVPDGGDLLAGGPGVTEITPPRQYPTGWQSVPNPEGGKTYTSPDRKTAYAADFENGQIAIQPLATEADFMGEQPAGNPPGTPAATNVAGGQKPANQARQSDASAANGAGANSGERPLPAGGSGQVPGSSGAVNSAVAVGNDIRPGDFVSLDRFVRDQIRADGQDPNGWQAVPGPGASMTYTSPDGKTTRTADFANGQISIGPAVTKTISPVPSNKMEGGQAGQAIPAGGATGTGDSGLAAILCERAKALRSDAQKDRESAAAPGQTNKAFFLEDAKMLDSMAQQREDLARFYDPAACPTQTQANPGDKSGTGQNETGSGGKVQTPPAINTGGGSNKVEGGGQTGQATPTGGTTTGAGSAADLCEQAKGLRMSAENDRSKSAAATDQDTRDFFMNQARMKDNMAKEREAACQPQTQTNPGGNSAKGQNETEGRGQTQTLPPSGTNAPIQQTSMTIGSGSSAVSKLPEGAVFATADVPPGSTIEAEQSGYAVIASAGVQSVQRVNSGDRLNASEVVSMLFDDGTGMLIDALRQTPPPISATVGSTPLLSQDQPQPLPLNNGKVTMYVGSNQPFDTPAIVTDTATKLPDTTYAAILNLNGEKVGQLSRYSPQTNGNLKIVTRDANGTTLNEAKVEGGELDGSASVSFDRQVYSAGSKGLLRMGNYGNYAKVLAKTRFGGAANVTKEPVRIVVLSDVKGLPSEVPFGTTQLAFTALHQGEALVAVYYPGIVPPTANPGNNQILKQANAHLNDWLSHLAKVKPSN